MRFSPDAPHYGEIHERGPAARELDTKFAESGVMPDLEAPLACTYRFAILLERVRSKFCEFRASDRGPESDSHIHLMAILHLHDSS